LADQIKVMIQDVRERKASPEARLHYGGPTPVVRPRGELAGIVSADYPLRRLDDLVLDSAVATKLRRIVDEYRNRAKLEDHGLKPRRKFLFQGPPGTGKTMTASALAGDLSMPLFTVLLDGIITKYMGETAAKVRLVFEAMKTTRGVYFFDEFDALASKRLLGNDVGEARRTLNSILQMMDETESDSIVIAATNHPELLDPAMFRRFDTTVDFNILRKSRLKEVYAKVLKAFLAGNLDWKKVEDASQGMSQAAIVRAAGDAARIAVLDNKAIVSTEILLDAIRERNPTVTDDEIETSLG
jgi:SpoVK/Ycf46/Vps4 family AAA+-type ATPase